MEDLQAMGTTSIIVVITTIVKRHTWKAETVR